MRTFWAVLFLIGSVACLGRGVWLIGQPAAWIAVAVVLGLISEEIGKG